MILLNKPKESVRDRILRAAEELATEAGAGKLSLDAVAARAGVSKGGLLYHFPNKAKLLESLVEQFVELFEAELSARTDDGSCNIGAAVLDMYLEAHRCDAPPPTGVLAALAENPGFLDPIRKHQRVLLDRIKESAEDKTSAIIVFLALQGIRSQELLSLHLLNPAEFDDVSARLREMAEE